MKKFRFVDPPPKAPGCPEPDYLAQNGEPLTIREKRAWVDKCAAEARAAGCTHIRATINPDDSNLWLIEGWKVEPEDQGSPRWQMTYAA